MGTSMSVLGRQTRFLGETMDTGRQRAGILRNDHETKPLELHRRLIWKPWKSMIHGGIRN